jgi:hypothetical protein
MPYDPPRRARGVLLFGASSVVASHLQPFYLWPGWSGEDASSTETAKMPIPSACKLQNARIYHNADAGNGGDVVYTLRVNGADSAIVLTLASDVIGEATDTSTTVDLEAGDLLSVEITKPGGSIGNGALRPVMTIEIAR